VFRQLCGIRQFEGRTSGALEQEQGKIRRKGINLDEY
jgi:hypothetical protein